MSMISDRLRAAWSALCGRPTVAFVRLADTLHVRGAARALVLCVEVEGADGDGIRLDGCRESRVLRCSVRGCTGSGFAAGGAP